jgi:hypothetical protein
MMTTISPGLDNSFRCVIPCLALAAADRRRWMVKSTNWRAPFLIWLKFTNALADQGAMRSAKTVAVRACEAFI